MKNEKFVARLNKLWPIGWVPSDEVEGVYCATVRGITVTVSTHQAADVVGTAGTGSRYYNDSLRKLLEQLFETVVVTSQQPLPGLAPVEDAQERIWKIVLQCLYHHRWERDVDTCRATWVSSVGTHVVSVTTYACNRYRVHMETRADDKLLYADSNLLEEWADENAVRNALTDVTYQMAGIK